jgi:[ribosomal protein S18]-alanine N-acetyltransferase
MSEYKTEVRFDHWHKDYNSQVLEIERLTSKFPITEKEFLHILSDRDTLGIVALKADIVIGYMVYRIFDRSILLLCLAVHPKWQRQGVGSQLINKLSQKLNKDTRRNITVNVRERNINAQLFLRKLGFNAVSVHRDWFFDSNEDSFYFNLSVRDSKNEKNAPIEDLQNQKETIYSK